MHYQITRMFKVVYILRNYLRKLFQKRKWSPKLFMIMFIGDRDKKKFPQEIDKFYYCLSYIKQIYQQPLLIETCTEIFSCLKKKRTFIQEDGHVQKSFMIIDCQFGFLPPRHRQDLTLSLTINFGLSPARQVIKTGSVVASLSALFPFRFLHLLLQFNLTFRGQLLIGRPIQVKWLLNIN